MAASRCETIRSGSCGAPCSRAERGAGEEHEGDHGRHRVARQPEDERVVAGAEPRRAAGAQRDAPEDLVDAERLQRRLDVVVGTDRDAAGEDEHVGLLERRGDRLAGLRLGVGHHAGAQHLRAGLRRQRGERRGVGVVQLAGAERLAGRDELVAGGQHDETRPARARDDSASGHHGDPDLGRAHPRARRQDGDAAAHVVAGRSHVAARVDVVLEGHAIAVDGHELELQHGVGAVGHGGAGRDPHRLAVADRHRGGSAGARLADEAQLAPGRAGAHGEAVHRAVGEGGDVVLRRRRPAPARGRARRPRERPRRAAGARRPAPVRAPRRW